MNQTPSTAIIGGSGLYQMKDLEVINSLDIDTPFGKPSSPIVIGKLENQIVAFLARHGIGHTKSPTEVNYRANIFALKMIGVRKIISISACGSLREDFRPGEIVVPDNLFDFTKDRERSFFRNGIVAHISSANPFCKSLSAIVSDAIEAAGGLLHRGGTLITIEGPRFSTKAESDIFRQWGMSIIGMTAAPEAFLAREAEMCYATMAHVTDYDVWHTSEEAVSVEMVIRTLNKNTELAQKAIHYLLKVPNLFDECECEMALKDALITHPDHVDAIQKDKLSLLVSKYLK